MSFATAYGNAFKTLQGVVGVSITYKRGTDSVSITALVGDTRMDIDDGSYANIRIVGRVRDYLVKQSELILSTLIVEPQQGDTIDEVRGSTTFTYEVMQAGGDSAFRPSDRHGESWRIHTKLIGTVVSA